MSEQFYNLGRQGAELTIPPLGTAAAVAAGPVIGRARQPLRVAFVITRSDAFGGASVHVRDLAARLQKSGHRVAVFIGGEGPVTEALAAAGVAYEPLRHLGRTVHAGRDFRAWLELRAGLRRFRPDLVSAHTSKAGALGRFTAWTLGLPAVYTPHCWSFVDGFPGARFYLWAEKAARRFGRRIIMVSEAERQEGLRRGVANADHLVTVRNGMPDIAPGFRANPGLTPPRIAMVGRCEEQKDHRTLLDALGELRTAAWTLEIIGDGPLRGELEARARRLGIGERVRFLGYSRDVAGRLAQAQIFALVTHWESFPRSIIEAMRAGLPAVASDVGGTGESIQDGRTGFVVPRGDRDALRNRLERLIRSAALRTEFGAAGRARYEAEFTAERMFRQTAAVWESVLGRPVEL
jgi:glycosyltransferase involved in cell wall biosynthesis